MVKSTDQRIAHRQYISGFETNNMIDILHILMVRALTWSKFHIQKILGGHLCYVPLIFNLGCNTSKGFLSISWFLAERRKICHPWWWSEALPWVSGFRNHGYLRMPATLPWYTRILRRFEYESGAANSITSGWEAGTEWSLGGRKECKAVGWKASNLSYK